MEGVGGNVPHATVLEVVFVLPVSYIIRALGTVLPKSRGSPDSQEGDSPHGNRLGNDGSVGNSDKAKDVGCEVIKNLEYIST